MLTYRDLYREVNRAAVALKGLGVKPGDVVAIYLPMVPEAAIAMLACARIGAPHTVVFGGFSPESLRDRINDSKAKILITADAGYRRGGLVPLVVPITLVRHHVRCLDISYLAGQLYLEPHPKELMLRNHV